MDFYCEDSVVCPYLKHKVNASCQKGDICRRVALRLAIVALICMLECHLKLTQIYLMMSAMATQSIGVATNINMP